MFEVVLFYNFHKTRNSTKVVIEQEQPTVNLQCRLLDSASMETPVFEFAFEGNNAPIGYTYAQIKALNRFYFIDEWEWRSPFWLAHMSVDVLASHKPAIEESEQYVTRSASISDGNLIDGQYATATDPTIKISQATNYNFVRKPSEGTYIIGVTNLSKNNVGTSTFYAMNQTMLQLFTVRLMTDVDWLGSITEIGQDLLKTLFNPLEYITTSFWIPLKLADIVGTSERKNTIKFGWWTLNRVDVYELDNPVFVTSFNITIPKHPQSATRGAWLNKSMQSRYQFIWGLAGTVVLDPTVIGAEDSELVFNTIDLASGSMTTSIGGQELVLNIGVPIKLTNISRDYHNAFKNVVGAGISAASKTFSGAFSSIDNAINSLLPQSTNINENGSFNNARLTPQIRAEFLPIADEDNSRYGRPLCQNRMIAELTGFIKCENARFSAPEISNTEAEKIESYMNGGFYNE